jgi:hypothetical protein
MPARPRLTALVAACLGALAIAGCTAGPAAGPAVSYAASQPPSPAPSWRPPPAEVAAFHALAEQEAGAWPRSPLGKIWKTGVVIPSTGDLTYVGNPRGFPSDEVREAFGNGNLVYTGPPPSGAPAAVVRWANGAASVKVPVLSEAQTFSALKSNTVVGRCPSCHTTPLAVTDAQPDTMGIPTNRGTAVVPAWLFSIPDLGGGVIQAALPPGSYVPESSAAGPAENLGPLGAAFVGANEASALSADGRTLGMYLASNPCSPPAKYGGLVAEVGGVVVVGGWIQDPQPIAGCAASRWGYNPGQYVTVRLAAPLGGRLILDAGTGLPAPYPFHPAPAATK